LGCLPTWRALSVIELVASDPRFAGVVGVFLDEERRALLARSEILKAEPKRRQGPRKPRSNGTQLKLNGPKSMRGTKSGRSDNEATATRGCEGNGNGDGDDAMVRSEEGLQPSVEATDDDDVDSGSGVDDDGHKGDNDDIDDDGGGGGDSDDDAGMGGDDDVRRSNCCAVGPLTYGGPGCGRRTGRGLTEGSFGEPLRISRERRQPRKTVIFDPSAESKPKRQRRMPAPCAGRNTNGFVATLGRPKESRPREVTVAAVAMIQGRPAAGAALSAWPATASPQVDVERDRGPRRGKARSGTPAIFQPWAPGSAAAFAAELAWPVVVGSFGPNPAATPVEEFHLFAFE
jgi:hypothetical protein